MIIGNGVNTVRNVCVHTCIICTYMYYMYMHGVVLPLCRWMCVIILCTHKRLVTILCCWCMISQCFLEKKTTWRQWLWNWISQWDQLVVVRLRVVSFSWSEWENDFQWPHCFAFYTHSDGPSDSSSCRCWPVCIAKYVFYVHGCGHTFFGGVIKFVREGEEIEWLAEGVGGESEGKNRRKVGRGRDTCTLYILACCHVWGKNSEFVRGHWW